MEMNDRIHTYLPSLTRSEQKVAESVLANTNDLMYYSVTELADFAGVGETTVMRFCRKIGFNGYQDFKLSLAQNVGVRRTDGQDEDEDHGDFVKMIFETNVNILKSSMSLLAKENLMQAIEWIDEATHVQFFGVGASGITALDAKNRLLRIGRRSEAATDSHIQAMMAVSMSEGDVAFGISVSGSTIDTNNMLMQAKENGAKVIAITNYAKSPITAIADIVLLTAGKEMPLEGGSIGAKISQLFIIDLICEGLARRNVVLTKQMKEKTARAVIDRSY